MTADELFQKPLRSIMTHPQLRADVKLRLRFHSARATQAPCTKIPDANLKEAGTAESSHDKGDSDDAR